MTLDVLLEGAMAMQQAAGKRIRMVEFFFPLFFLLVLLFPQSSWAVQQHGGAEGLVSHQIGHLLFISGMVYLLCRLHHFAPTGAGWFEFRLFAWLIICWNLLTFYGHWHMELLDPAKLVAARGRTIGMVISGPMDALFYFSSLDHLILLPAFVCLLAALVKWRRQP